MPAPGRFGAVICAMATPFDAEGRLDLPGAARLASWLADNGNDGLVLAGTTGEAPTLSDEEKLELWRAVRAAVSVPLIANTGTASTAHSVELTIAAAEVGMDAALVVTPYYNRPSQAGIEAHLRAVAAATDLPVIIYDVPKRTGREVRLATLQRLAGDGVIAGVKDAAGTPAVTAALVAAAPDGFEVYSGDDALDPGPTRGRGRRGNQRGVALGRRTYGRNGRGVQQGRHRIGHGVERSPGRVLGLRGQRRSPEPRTHEGHAEGTGVAWRRLPPADGPRARRSGGKGGTSLEPSSPPSPSAGLNFIRDRRRRPPLVVGWQWLARELRSKMPVTLSTVRNS